MQASKARHGTQTRRRGAATWIAALAVLGGAMGVGAPARAGNDFANGFEDQLGRLAAIQVVRFGQLLLTGGVAPHPHGHHWAGHARGHPAVYGPAPYRHVHPHAAPTATVVVLGVPQAPCSGHPPVASGPPAPYGEHIVYERYERTVYPPPHLLEPEPTAPTRIRY